MRLSLSKLESFLRSFESDVELREFQDPVRDEIEAVDARIAEFFASDVSLLQGLSKHVLGLKGKKFRPTLLLLIARFGTARRDDAVFCAAIVELIHTATLIHDDTIDKSLLRRGLPTINALYNGYVSTILGDYIYTKAFLELLERGLPATVPVIARTTYRMSIGELLQIEQRNQLEITEADYFRLIDEKTASLMSAATQMGALVAGMDAADVERFRLFGEELGRAYQVTDDLFDYIGEADRMGKGTRSDLTEGKITLPLIHALQHSTGTSRARLRDLAAKRELNDDEWTELIELLASSGAISYCRDRASEFADSALSRLNAGGNPAPRLALTQAVAYAVKRNH